MVRILGLFFLFVFLFIGCKPSVKEYDKSPIKFKVSKEFSQKEVSEFVSKALLRLGWKVDAIKEGSISASLNHRSWLAKTTVNFNAQNEIVILSDSVFKVERPSENIGQKPNVVYYKRVPFNWLMNIKKIVLEESKIKKEVQVLHSN